MDTKALRQKVLDLAIRGKLVPQDPNDEPASVLLERIRQQRQQMVKDGKLKTKDIKNDTIIFVGEDNLHYEKFADGSVKCIEDEIPFDLPDGWAWSRLGSLLALFITGPFGSALHKSDYVADGIPLINPMNIIDGKVVPIDKMQVSPETVERLSSFKVAPNDIVIARRGDMGRCAVVQPEQEGWLCGTGSFVLRFPSALCSEYFAVCLRSPYSVEYLSGNSIGNTMLNLNQAILKSILLPVPPCSEQNRIINAIFDADIHLAKITNQREALVMYIAKAKSKILDLAIRGRLVPQDPDDEPATALLERIRAEKEELIRQGKIKRDKKESVIFRGEDNSYYEKIGSKVEKINDEIPFELPEGWAWCRGYSCFEGMESIKPQGDFFDYIDIDAIDNRLHRIKEAKHIPVTDAPSRASRAVKNGSVLFSLVRPYLENIALVEEKHSRCIASTGFYVCNSNGVLLPEFMFFLMISSYVVDGLNQYMKGDNSPSISKDNIERWIYPVPPMEEQKAICSKLKSLFAMIENIEKSLN